MALITIPNEIYEKLNKGEILWTDLEHYDGKYEEPKEKLKKPLVELEYVYIVKSRNWFKIGRTKSIETRLKTYFRADPTAKLIFKQKCKNSTKLEKIMLNIFPERRIGNTEWFNFSSDEVKQIINIAVLKK